MNGYIKSIGAYVPEKRITNDELALTVETSDEWIRSHTGIGARHIVGDDQAASDLAIEASKIALKNGGLEPDQIDLIIVATASPDYPGFPSTACIVQDKLGIRQAGAFDLAAGCTGFVYGLETARAFVRSGSARNVLLIGVDVLSRITNWKDRNTCVLFGDGAGAAVISATDETAGGEMESGIIDSILRSEGSGAEHLIRKAGGSRLEYDPAVVPEADYYISMNGRQVYNFAVRVNTEVIKELLLRNNLEIDAVHRIVPHQANMRIIEAAASRLKIPMEKFFMNIEDYANTSAASIPIALYEMVENGQLARGDLVLLVGFGAGLTYGGNLVRW